MIWSDVRLSKTITLGYGGQDGVAQFIASVYIPNTVTRITGVNAPHVATSLYVRSNFRTLSAFNPATNTLYSVAMGGLWGWANVAAYTWPRTGAILSDPTTGMAVGFYMIFTSAGGTSNFWSCYNANTNTTGTAPENGDCYAVFNGRALDNMPAGTYPIRTYVVCGTSVAQVRSKMLALFNSGAN